MDSVNAGGGHNSQQYNSYQHNKKQLTFVFRKTGNQGQVDTGTGWDETGSVFGWEGWPRSRSFTGPIVINVLKDKDGNSTENTNIFVDNTNGYNADTVTTFAADPASGFLVTTQFNAGDKVYDNNDNLVGTVQSRNSTSITLTANNLVALPNDTHLKRIS